MELISAPIYQNSMAFEEIMKDNSIIITKKILKTFTKRQQEQILLKRLQLKLLVIDAPPALANVLIKNSKDYVLHLIQNCEALTEAVRPALSAMRCKRKRKTQLKEHPKRLFVHGRHRFNEGMCGVYEKLNILWEERVCYKQIRSLIANEEKYNWVIRWYEPKKQWLFDYKGLRDTGRANARVQEDVINPILITKDWRVFNGKKTVTDPQLKIEHYRGQDIELPRENQIGETLPQQPRHYDHNNNNLPPYNSSNNKVKNNNNHSSINISQSRRKPVGGTVAPVEDLSSESQSSLVLVEVEGEEAGDLIVPGQKPAHQSRSRSCSPGREEEYYNAVAIKNLDIDSLVSAQDSNELRQTEIKDLQENLYKVKTENYKLKLAVVNLKKEIANYANIEDTNSSCIVCMDGKAIHACIPCGHLVLCKECKNEVGDVTSCYICRAATDMVCRIR